MLLYCLLIYFYSKNYSDIWQVTFSKLFAQSDFSLVRSLLLWLLLTMLQHFTYNVAKNLWETKTPNGWPNFDTCSHFKMWQVQANLNQSYILFKCGIVGYHKTKISALILRKLLQHLTINKFSFYFSFLLNFCFNAFGIYFGIVLKNLIIFFCSR